MIPYRKHSHVNKVWCDGCNVSKVWKKDMFCVDTNRNEDLLNRVNDDKRHQHDTSCCKKYTLHYAWFAWHTLHRCTCTHHISILYRLCNIYMPISRNWYVACEICAFYFKIHIAWSALETFLSELNQLRLYI